MNNIKLTEKSVNDFSVEKLTELYTYTFLIRTSPTFTPSEAYLFENGFILFDFAESDIKVNNCPFNVPQSSCYSPSQKEKKPRRPAKEKWSHIRKKLDRKVLQDKDILYGYEEIATQQVIIHHYKYDLVHLTYKAMYKGSAVYNYMMANKIVEDAGLFSSICKYRYFLTLTCDPSNYDESQLDAWECHNKETSLFFKKLCREFDCLYQKVVESTYRGFPHTHAIIYSDHPLCGEKEPVNKERKIKRGKLVDFIKENSSARIFDLKHLKDSNINKYLVKYLSKSYDVKNKEEHKSILKLGKEKRKGMLCNVMTVISGARSYSSSNRRRITNYAKRFEKENVIKKAVDVIREPKIVIGQQVFNHRFKLATRSKEIWCEVARRAKSLIDFRINSPENCGRCLEIVPHTDFRHVPPEDRGKVVGREPSFLSNPDCKKIKIGCKGCKLMDLRKKTAEQRAEKGLPIPERVPFTYEEFCQLNIDLWLENKRKEEYHKEEKRALLGVDELPEERRDRLTAEWLNRKDKKTHTLPKVLQGIADAGGQLSISFEKY